MCKTATNNVLLAVLQLIENFLEYIIAMCIC